MYMKSAVKDILIAGFTLSSIAAFFLGMAMSSFCEGSTNDGILYAVISAFAIGAVVLVMIYMIQRSEITSISLGGKCRIEDDWIVSEMKFGQAEVVGGNKVPRNFFFFDVKP